MSKPLPEGSADFAPAPGGRPYVLSFAAQETSTCQALPSHIIGQHTLHFVPIIHNALESARTVYEAIDYYKPRIVAVELPPELKTVMLNAAERLPFMSVLAYKDLTIEQGRNRFFMLIEPACPLTEAVRRGVERGALCSFIDLQVSGYVEHNDNCPDPYVISTLGLQTYTETFFRTIPRQNIDHADDARERHMAYKIKQLLARPGSGSVLVVCGMLHMQRMIAHIKLGTDRLGTPAPVGEVTLYDPALTTIKRFCREMPFLNTVYEFCRTGPLGERYWQPDESEQSSIFSGLDFNFIDDLNSPDGDDCDSQDHCHNCCEMEGDDDAALDQELEDSLKELGNLAPNDVKDGAELNGPPLEMLAGPEPFWQNISTAAKRSLLSRLRRLREVFYLPNAEIPLPPEPKEAPSSSDSAQIRRTIVFNSGNLKPELLEAFRWLRSVSYENTKNVDGNSAAVDRQQALALLLRIAASVYQENTGETFKTWQRRLLMKYTANYCRLQRRLLPGLYQLVVSSQSCVDDNFAYEVWDFGSFYPWIDGEDFYPQIDIDEKTDEFLLDGKMMKMSFYRSFTQWQKRLSKMRQRPASNESAQDLLRPFEGGYICSYEPEDIVIEDFVAFLKNKAVSLISSEKERIEPFSVSLYDGVDMRETLRHWADGRQLYVRELRRGQSSCGTVVIIFADGQEAERYSWCLTWQGENRQESDMAFYATPYRHKLVGPGIARCEYGGLLMNVPNRTMYEVWNDQVFSNFKSKAEVLLAAAIYYAQEKSIMYVAEHPPRSYLKNLAQRYGHRIIHYPLSQLSPLTVKKIRVFHVLSGHQVRDYAKNYIW